MDDKKLQESIDSIHKLIAQNRKDYQECIQALTDLVNENFEKLQNKLRKSFAERDARLDKLEATD